MSTANEVKVKQFFKKAGIPERFARLLPVISGDPLIRDAVETAQDVISFEQSVLLAELTELEAQVKPAQELHDRSSEKSAAAAALAKAAAKDAERVALADLLRGNAAMAALHGKIIVKKEEIKSKSDPRIGQMRFYLTPVAEAARYAGRTWIGNVHAPVGTPGRVVGNLADRDGGIEGCKREFAYYDVLELRPMRDKEVTAALRASCERLAPLLAPLELNPPSLDKDFEPGPAVTWHGRSQWLFDEPQPQPLRESQLRLRDEAMKAAEVAAQNKRATRR